MAGHARMIKPMQVDFDSTEFAFRSFSDTELKKSFFMFSLMNKTFLTQMATLLVPSLVKLRTPLNLLIKNLVFKQFFGGESLPVCAKVIANLEKEGVGAVLDFACEGEQSKEESTRIFKEVANNIEFIKNSTLPKFVVIKVSAMLPMAVLEQGWDRSPAGMTGAGMADVVMAEEVARFEKEMEKLCQLAHAHGASILIDAEETWIQGWIDQFSLRLMEKFNKDRPLIYMTLQMYRRDRLVYLEELAQKAQDKGYFLGIKLVRGAYMVQERERAARLGYPSPIHPDKRATDHAFDHALAFCVKHIDRIHLFVGTHNEQSTKLAISLIQDHGIESRSSKLIFSQLYGMSNHLTYNLAHHGFYAYKYLPYGPFLKAIPYLLRRAQENSALEGQSNRELEVLRKELSRRRALCSKNGSS